MNQNAKWLALLSVFVISAFAMMPVAAFPGFGETLKGNLGESTWGYYLALGRFDMIQDESVRCNLDANRDFVLVVRDLADIIGPLGPDYYEGPFLLNITAASVEGTFYAPYDGTFVFQFFVLFSMDYSWFNLDYKLEKVTLLDESIGYAIPWFAIVLFAACVIIWAAAWRWAVATPTTNSAFLRFWRHFSSRPWYWVMPFAGMALCIVVVVIEPDASERNDLLSLAMELSGIITRLGIVLGLIAGFALHDKRD